MARRKRKDESPDWVPPEFDEVAYMRQEIEATRAAVATIAWAIMGAIVAFLLYSVLPVLAFFAGIAVGFGMYFVFPLIGIKTDAFKRRDWTGHGITYFFSWLAFWIILLNPPFGDFTAPTIQGISVSPYRLGYDKNLTCEPVAGSITVPLNGNNSIQILFRATDNVGLASIAVSVAQIGPINVTPPAYAKPPPGSHCLGHWGEPFPAGTYSVTFPVSGSTYDVTISATDTSGHGTSVSFSIHPV